MTFGCEEDFSSDDAEEVIQKIARAALSTIRVRGIKSGKIRLSILSEGEFIKTPTTEIPEELWARKTR